MRAIAAFLLWMAISFGAAAEEYSAQGDKTPFPTEAWAEVAPDDRLRAALGPVLARAFEGTRLPALSNTKAMVVIVGGRLAAERYAVGITKDTRLQGDRHVVAYVQPLHSQGHLRERCPLQAAVIAVCIQAFPDRLAAPHGLLALQHRPTRAHGQLLNLEG